MWSKHTVSHPKLSGGYSTSSHVILLVSHGEGCYHGWAKEGSINVSEEVFSVKVSPNTPHWWLKGCRLWTVLYLLGFFLFNLIIPTLSLSFSPTQLSKQGTWTLASFPDSSMSQIHKHLSRDHPANIWFHPALHQARFPGSRVLCPSVSVLTVLGSLPTQDLIYLSSLHLCSLLSIPLTSIHSSFNATQLAPLYLSAYKIGIAH